MQRPSLEVAQIFRHHGEDYRESHRLSTEQNKAMGDIERCRTSALGGHVDLCSNGCGYASISYNSCRNRHCPKCQSLKQAKWLKERTERLLPVTYFHLVVTLPHELNPLVLLNQRLLYTLFFDAACQALLEFAMSYERLRAQVGFTAVLHTWDQDLNFHPHLHIVVTGGGLSPEGDRWISARNSFLVPVKALSKIIRAKFTQSLEETFQEGSLKGNSQCLRNSAEFKRFLRKLRRNKWIVYCKEALGRSQKAYHYISRYTHRVAISNHRLMSLADGNITFQARDNSRPGEKRLVTTTVQEFIRRFLLHILPPRFVKIRHFGLMAPCNAKTKLEIARHLISQQELVSNDHSTGQKLDNPLATKTWQEMMHDLTGIDLTTCPRCRKGRLIRFKLIGSEDILAPAIWDSS
jgi:hypothetical protein